MVNDADDDRAALSMGKPMEIPAPARATRGGLFRFFRLIVCLCSRPCVPRNWFIKIFLVLLLYYSCGEVD